MRSSTENQEQYEDTGDRLSVKDKEKRAKIREERRVGALKAFMKTADGRLWMWELFSLTGLFRTDFNGNSRDYFNLGMRNTAMPVFNDVLNHCTDDFMLMIQENKHV